MIKQTLFEGKRKLVRPPVICIAQLLNTAATGGGKISSSAKLNQI
jgi:hypothetical protein